MEAGFLDFLPALTKLPIIRNIVLLARRAGGISQIAGHARALSTPPSSGTELQYQGNSRIFDGWLLHEHQWTLDFLHGVAGIPQWHQPRISTQISGVTSA